MNLRIPNPNDICEWLLSTGALQLTDIQRATRLGLAQGIAEDEKLHTLLRLGAVKEQQMATAYAQLLGAPS